MFKHTAIVGTARLTWYGLDDKQVRERVVRWVNIFWKDYASKYPGSLRYAVNNGWYDSYPGIQITRLWKDPDAIAWPAKNPTVIEKIPLWHGEKLRFERGMIIADA